MGCGSGGSRSLQELTHVSDVLTHLVSGPFGCAGANGLADRQQLTSDDLLLP